MTLAQELPIEAPEAEVRVRRRIRPTTILIYLVLLVFAAIYIGPLY